MGNDQTQESFKGVNGHEFSADANILTASPNIYVRKAKCPTTPLEQELVCKTVNLMDPSKKEQASF